MRTVFSLRWHFLDIFSFFVSCLEKEKYPVMKNINMNALWMTKRRQLLTSPRINDDSTEIELCPFNVHQLGKTEYFRPSWRSEVYLYIEREKERLRVREWERMLEGECVCTCVCVRACVCICVCALVCFCVSYDCKIPYSNFQR